MEEKKDKYQESTEDELIDSESEHLEEKIPEKKEKSLPSEKTRAALETEGQPSKESKKDLSAEALAEVEVPVKEEVLDFPKTLEKPTEPISEKVEPALEAEGQPSGGSSVASATDDQALRSKKVEEIKKLSKEEQIKALCNLAFEKDIDFAAEIAKGLDDAYVLDEFHDSLDKLSLIEKGKLKKI